MAPEKCVPTTGIKYVLNVCVTYKRNVVFFLLFFFFFFYAISRNEPSFRHRVTSPLSESYNVIIYGLWFRFAVRDSRPPPLKGCCRTSRRPRRIAVRGFVRRQPSADGGGAWVMNDFTVVTVCTTFVAVGHSLSVTGHDRSRTGLAAVRLSDSLYTARGAVFVAAPNMIHWISFPISPECGPPKSRDRSPRSFARPRSLLTCH